MLQSVACLGGGGQHEPCSATNDTSVAFSIDADHRDAQMKCEDLLRKHRVGTLELRGAHLLDFAVYIQDALQRELVTNINVVVAVEDPDVIAADARERLTLSLSGASFLQVFNAVALQLGIEYSLTNRLVVFRDSALSPHAAHARTDFPMQAFVGTIDPLRLSVVRTNDATVVSLSFRRWSNGVSLIDKSTTHADGVWSLSFQVVYGAHYGGMQVSDTVTWLLDGPVVLPSSIRVVRLPDGRGHLDTIDVSHERIIERSTDRSVPSPLEGH